MSTGEWSLAAVHDVVAAAVPDREMVVCGAVRRTYGEVAGRTRSLAAFLGARGLGVRRERGELERWESGQDTVALVLHNCAEYLEAMLGAFRARAVPFNVNQHYRPAEVGALLADLDARAVVYHRALGPLVAAACESAPGCDLPARARRRRRRVGRGAAAGQHDLRGRGRHAGRGVAAGAVARRPLPRLHRRHHGPPQGGAVAPGRHLRVGHGRRRGRHRRVDRRDRQRRRRWRGTPCRRSCTPPPSGRPSRACTTAPPSCSTTTRGPSTPAQILELAEREQVGHDVDRRRRLRRPARRGAAAPAATTWRRCA